MTARELALISEIGAMFITDLHGGHFQVLRDTDELVSYYGDCESELPPLRPCRALKWGLLL